MNTSELKLDLIKYISNIEDIQILERLKQFLEVNKISENVRVFTPEQQARVNRALEQYKNGECISNEEAEKEIQQWLED
ncbi:hypothetical protein ACFPVY_14555 [Flavobacterium qiangtangense]|uniref:Addiction module component n=1 Tax=Flavobacterium qiangtangense TaxID=1442595 RepID=A0ABW1PRX4_9FLAO